MDLHGVFCEVCNLSASESPCGINGINNIFLCLLVITVSETGAKKVTNHKILGMIGVKKDIQGAATTYLPHMSH